MTRRFQTAAAASSSTQVLAVIAGAHGSTADRTGAIVTVQIRCLPLRGVFGDIPREITRAFDVGSRPLQYCTVQYLHCHHIPGATCNIYSNIL
jgi:hypothetical protein